MKVGELASLKEASSRSTNARLEAIRRLEAQLASEREIHQKALNSLSSQLAFRDADYKLVSAELAQIKMMQSTLLAPDDEPTSLLSQSMFNSLIN